MSSSGFLVPANQNPSSAELWNETWRRLDRFLPDLRKDLELEQPKVAKIAAAPQSMDMKVEGANDAPEEAVESKKVEPI